MNSYISRRFLPATIVVVCLLVLSVAFAYGQESTTPTTNTLRTAQVGQGQSIVDRVEQRRTTAQQRNAAARQNFTRSLAGITDEAKQTIVERISNALQTINTNKTNAWARILETLSSILERISSKTAELEASGVDVTTVNELISTAESAIATASTAVEEQAAEQYVIEITDEATLRESIQPVIQQFKQDLRTTLASVANARDAVRQAARGLASLRPLQNNVGTQSAQPDLESDIIQ